jgi:vitamin B12 transporter
MKKFNFNINVNYVGERYDRNYSSTNTPTPNGEQTGKYTVINTVINYKHNKSTSFYVKVDNIGDKKYEVVDGYSTSPRAYYAGLKYNF